MVKKGAFLKDLEEIFKKENTLPVLTSSLLETVGKKNQEGNLYEVRGFLVPIRPLGITSYIPGKGADTSSLSFFDLIGFHGSFTDGSKGYFCPTTTNIQGECMFCKIYDELSPEDMNSNDQQKNKAIASVARSYIVNFVVVPFREREVMHPVLFARVFPFYLSFGRNRNVQLQRRELAGLLSWNAKLDPSKVYAVSLGLVVPQDNKREIPPFSVRYLKIKETEEDIGDKTREISEAYPDIILRHGLMTPFRKIVVPDESAEESLKAVLPFFSEVQKENNPQEETEEEVIEEFPETIDVLDFDPFSGEIGDEK